MFYFLCLFLDKKHINIVFVSEVDDYYTPEDLETLFCSLNEKVQY